QTASLTSPEAALDLVQIRLDETRRTLSDTGSDTRGARDDYQRIVRELEVNVDRDAKGKSKGAVDDKLGVTRSKIAMPLERPGGCKGPYPTCEESVQNLYEAVERDVAAKTPGNPNRDAHVKAARACQENLDWLIEDLSKVLDAMEEGLLWGEVLERAIQLERSQRQYAEQFRVLHNQAVLDLLRDSGVLDPNPPAKKDEKKDKNK